MIRQVEYFEKPVKENTFRCLEIVSALVDEGFSHLVVATTTGETGLLFARKLLGKTLNVVAVTITSVMRVKIRMNVLLRRDRS